MKVSALTFYQSALEWGGLEVDSLSARHQWAHSASSVAVMPRISTS
jgi:hypothetical protein